jgi:hypothetical protein
MGQLDTRRTPYYLKIKERLNTHMAVTVLNDVLNDLPVSMPKIKVAMYMIDKHLPNLQATHVDVVVHEPQSVNDINDLLLEAEVPTEVMEALGFTVAPAPEPDGDA